MRSRVCAWAPGLKDVKGRAHTCTLSYAYKGMPYHCKVHTLLPVHAMAASSWVRGTPSSLLQGCEGMVCLQPQAGGQACAHARHRTHVPPG